MYKIECLLRRANEKEKPMSLRNYGNYVGIIVCLSFNNDFN